MAKNSKVICVIVDAFSTGKFIAPALLGYGYKCIHVQSDKSLPVNLTDTLWNHDFLKTIVFENNIDSVLDGLKDYQIKLCIPGCESGVELADELSAKLGLPTNNLSLTKARRCKWEMIEVLSSKGLLTAKHFKSNNSKDILEWIKKNNIHFPIVLKPLSSANGDNVHFCHSIEMIEKLSQKIMSANDFFGKRNIKFLAETYLDGQEYIVNTVSRNGQHLIVEIWCVNRVPFSTIYDTCEILDSSYPYYKEISEYTKNVLTALGVIYGAATTELKYTSNGITIIEMAARLMGGAELSFSTEIFGHNQLTLLLESYLNPEDFSEKIKKRPRLNKFFGMAVLLISNAEGHVFREPEVTELTDLESFFSMKIPSKGESLVITTNSLTDAGFVYLLNDSKGKLLEDRQKIRAIEEQLYTAMIE